jgi:hypothetical protein
VSTSIAVAVAAIAAAALGACVKPPERTTMPPVAPASSAGAADDGAVPESMRAGAAPSIVVWTGRGLDGVDVTLASDDTPPGVTFVGRRPSVVAHIDHLAKAHDCAALADQLTFWTFQADADAVHGHVASAFARHAADVATFVGCAGVGAPSNG